MFVTVLQLSVLQVAASTSFQYNMPTQSIVSSTAVYCKPLARAMKASSWPAANWFTLISASSRCGIIQCLDVLVS